jgi:hypothetical protein
MNIQTIREKYPQYYDLSDKQLADAIHNKFYSDMPINQFYAKIGFQENQSKIDKKNNHKQDSIYIKSQNNNNYSQPQITTNQPINTQNQIAVNPTIKNNDHQINQQDNSIYFLSLLTIVFIIFIIKFSNRNKYENKNNIYYEHMENTPNISSKFNDLMLNLFTTSIVIIMFAIGCFQMYAIFIYFNSYLKWETFSSALAASSTLILPFGSFIGSILSVIAATNVWDWNFWLALLVFLPKALMGVIGISIASISSLFTNKN